MPEGGPRVEQINTLFCLNLKVKTRKLTDDFPNVSHILFKTVIFGDFTVFSGFVEK